MAMRYWLVDVFAERPLAGNGLTVFPDASGMSTELMQSLTRELRQFETAFLQPSADPARFDLRVFTMEEELPFAGHPVLGAAALLHHLRAGETPARWRLRLPAKEVVVDTSRLGDAIQARMDQGAPSFIGELAPEDTRWFADRFSAERDERYPAQVISTGLPYLILPVTAAGLAAARQRQSLEPRLSAIGASFVYLLDVDAREGRTWDPDGVVEDIATGSAAGPVAAYLHRTRHTPVDETVTVHQGRFAGRPSRMSTRVSADGRIEVGGDVQIIAAADLLAELP
ncbi:PhzF family phenazine biosynthesis protein [Microbacterium resistens]|nr:PhzF family phenazine biosynthesis protein [Microbacterium resistens]